MDVYLLRERSSGYRNLVKTEDALPIYECINKSDYAEIVKAAQEVLKKTSRMPMVPKMEKTVERCNKLRVLANNAFRRNQYQTALMHWNMSLCHAPNESRILKLIYAKRSTVFQKIGAYGAALADIDICMRMGCPSDMEERLKYFHRQCREIGWVEKLAEAAIPDVHSLGKFFKLHSTNPQIPTCTMDIGVAVTSTNKTIMAAKDINVGTVVALESAYVSQTNDTHKYLACSFCHKLALNLIPCTHCCDTLFCSPICMELAMKEYHEIECHLSEVLRNSSTECRMALKAVVRMRTMAKDWDTFITNTKVLGKERMLGTPLVDVFSEIYPYTILCVETEKPFVHGTMYNAAIDCAVVMFYLEKLPMFIPKGSNRKEAINSVTRVMMHLSVYHTFVQMQVVIGQKDVEPYSHDAHNYGWFPLISKLKNSCVPNVIALAMNKEIALIAVQPIKAGTEITLAYLGHWLEHPGGPRRRQRSLFALSGSLCKCRLCMVGIPREEYILSEKQEKNWRRLNLEAIKDRITSDKVDGYYERLCRALTLFADLPFSAEFAAIYGAFRRCLRFYQAAGYPQRLAFNDVDKRDTPDSPGT